MPAETPAHAAYRTSLLTRMVTLLVVCRSRVVNEVYLVCALAPASARGAHPSWIIDRQLSCRGLDCGREGLRGAHTWHLMAFSVRLLPDVPACCCGAEDAPIA